MDGWNIAMDGYFKRFARRNRKLKHATPWEVSTTTHSLLAHLQAHIYMLLSLACIFLLKGRIKSDLVTCPDVPEK